MTARGDRVGLGWRPQLAASILVHREAIDLVEVIADDWLGAPARRVRALAALARTVPVSLHAVSLGLAGAEAVDERRLDALARLRDAVAPVAVSEHLAFVRAGGVELRHLGAPPRSAATLASLAHNVARARRVLGEAPLLENVASLVEPPACELDEGPWLRAVAAETGAPLLLDLHNLHANGHNFGFDALAAVESLPLERVRQIHLAGGRLLDGGRRLLDDHLHPAPAEVFVLLEAVAARAPGALDVVLERDGAYPPMEVLLAELGATREALRRGRARARQRASAALTTEPRAAAAMEPRPLHARVREAQAHEGLLRAFGALLAEPDARKALRAAPDALSRRFSLTPAAARALGALSDRDLALAAETFSRKASAHARHLRLRPSPWRRLWERLRDDALG